MVNFFPLFKIIEKQNAKPKRNNFSSVNMHFLKDRLKVHWKTPQIYIQACTEYIDAKVGCGECIVCKAYAITINDVVRPNNPKFWPVGSEAIAEAYKNLELIDDINYLKLRDRVQNFVPVCINLKSSAWNGSEEIKFNEPLLYAMTVKNYLEMIHIS